MAASAPAAGAIHPVIDRDGPLPRLLFVLTAVTGLVDAVSYLTLGRVFVANMTGNVVILGFAVAGAGDFSIPASLAAIVAFLGGALAGGRVGSSHGHHRGRLLALGVLGEILLVGAALVVAITVSERHLLQYDLIVLLALAMGLQNAVARRLAVADMTTTVLTLTLTGLAADSTLAKGSNPRPGRRWLATATMFLGAGVGAVLVLRVHVAAALALTLALLILTGLAAYRASSSSESWTTGG